MTKYSLLGFLSFLAIINITRGQSISTFATFTNSSVEFSPPSIDNVEEGTEHTIGVSFCGNTSSFDLPTHLNMSLDTSDTQTFQILEGNAILRLERSVTSFPPYGGQMSSACYQRNFTIRSSRLGRANLLVRIFNSDENLWSGNYDVTVIRARRLVDSIFNILLILFVIINNVGFGSKFDFPTAVEVFKKPVAPVIGFLCQYGMMPVIAFGLGKLLQLNPALAFGLLAVGAAPGGGQSNVWTILTGGDLTLSVCMTLVSSFASLGMMPLWLLTLGRVVIQDDSIKIPFLEIFLSLLILVIPLSTGLLIRRFLPRVGSYVQKAVRPTAFFYILFLLTMGIYSNWYAVRYMFTEWRVLVAALCLPWGGSLLSGTVAALCCQPWKRVKTIAIETAFQNGAIALVLVRNSFGQPEADVMSIMTVASTVTTPMPFIVIFIVRVIRYLVKGRKEEPEDTEDKEVKLSDMDAAESTITSGVRGSFARRADIIRDGGQGRQVTGQDNPAVADQQEPQTIKY